MFAKLANIFRAPDLRKRVFYTLLMIVVMRLTAFVPIPFIDQNALNDFMRNLGTAGGIFSFVNMFTGGAFQNMTVGALGIMPYISASIIFQLLMVVWPRLEKIAKEGEAGRKKINEYTRYLTVLLCVIQGVMILTAKQGQWLAGNEDISRPFYTITAMTAITAGTIFLMWLGEQIDEFGIGNGISLIIMAGIVDRLPAVAKILMSEGSWSLTESSGISIGTMLLIVAMFVGIVLGVVMITQGQRRIPIQQAKMVRGRRVFGSSQRQYLPLRINQAGVIPVIFASSLLIVPPMLFNYLASTWPNGFTYGLQGAFQYGGVIYQLLYVGLIFVFCYFWTAIQFKPNEMAENLRDYGSFIPGMRPGRRTAEYLEKVMNRITYVGAAFLAIIAIIPLVVSNLTHVPQMITGFLGGTGLLIIVSVALDVVQRIESHLIMRHYEGFLTTGRIRGRRG